MPNSNSSASPARQSNPVFEFFVSLKLAVVLLAVLIVAAIAGLAGCTSHKKAESLSGAGRPASSGSKWGYYDGEPVTKWNPDGRTMTLLTELRYTDPHGQVWVAPIGSVVDGASIPRYLWSIMGGPFEGKYRNASVLHDVAYEQQNRPWQDCDRMFYTLYRFGHHWKFSIKRAKPVTFGGEMVARGEEIPRAIPVNPDQINEARDWIRRAEPSLEQIEQRAEAEGH